MNRKRLFLITFVKGVEILKQHQLPQSVIDICAEHHGTTLMKYFYAEALKDNPDADEADFRYPGPKPQTKEICSHQYRG